MGVIVTITEQSGNDLVDYQVRVEITDPDFFQECTDKKYIECYFQDGSWIPHWVEEFNPTGNKAVIWVKVPQIPANGTVKVFIKVNPTRTEDLSNGEAVFEFFDDFSQDPTTKGWTLGTGFSWNSEKGYLHFERAEDVGVNAESPFTISDGVVHYKLRYTGTGVGANDFLFLNLRRTDTDGYLVGLGKESGFGEGVHIGARKDGSWRGWLKQVAYDYNLNQWYEVKVAIIGSPARIKVWVEDTLVVDWTDTVVQDSSGKLGVHGRDCVGDIDYIFVRKYIEPEPTVSVEYVSETVTYSDYFYWGMAKMLSGAIANLMQLPIKMEIYSGSNLLKTLSLKEISTITDAENKYIISVLKFEDDSSDSYQTDKQIVYVTDPDGNTRKLAESTYVFIKMAELPLLLGFEIRIPYEDTQVELS